MRLKERFSTEVRPGLQEEFQYKNPMQVPRLEKVVVNMGLGEAVQNVKIIDFASAELAAITGQKPVIAKARKSIATFKLRAGMPIGVKVTLRRDRMWDFLERLLYISLPAVRDFRGVSAKGFDGKGNYTLGIKEQIIFPEVEYDKVDKLRGMNITFVTTAKTDEEARSMLRRIGMPFRK